MADDIRVTNADIFAYYAGKDKEKWEVLIDQSITYRKYQDGRLAEVEPHNAQLLLHIDLQGDEEVSMFYVDDFAKNFDIRKIPLEIPNTEEIRKQVFDEKLKKQEEEAARIAELKRLEELRLREEAERQHQEELRRLQEEKERAASQEFNHLREKYGIKSDQESNPTSPLFPILLKREENQVLSQKEEQWLEGKKFYEFLGDYLLWKIDFLSEPGLFAKAGSYFRNAKMPSKVIEKIPIELKGNPRCTAQLLTNRGGAYKDLGEFEKAIECADKARRLQPRSFYPYNLFGGIYYRKGEHQKGDSYFERAIELGSPSRVQDAEIWRSFNEISDEEKRQTAEYLIKKDPKRYAWANEYL
jgi:tetratricopeptide (TPR) repeat protein